MYATLGNDAAPATELASALALMNGVEGKLRDELIKRIKQAAERMRQEIAALATLGQVAADGVRADLDKVDAAAAPPRPQVEQAQAALDRAREGYVNALSGSLHVVLAVPNPPFGFDKAAWDTFRAAIDGELVNVLAEPRLDRRVERWNDVSFRYLAKVVGQAHAAVDAKLAPPPADPTRRTLGGGSGEAGGGGQGVDGPPAHGGAGRL